MHAIVYFLSESHGMYEIGNLCTSCADPEGGTGGPDPPENHKNIGFLSNIGPDPLKITKLPSQHTTVGHYQPVSETPFKWRFAGGPMMARLY